MTQVTEKNERKEAILNELLDVLQTQTFHDTYTGILEHYITGEVEVSKSEVLKEIEWLFRRVLEL